jgi:hypothetical protein
VRDVGHDWWTCVLGRDDCGVTRSRPGAWSARTGASHAKMSSYEPRRRTLRRSRNEQEVRRSYRGV